MRYKGGGGTLIFNENLIFLNDVVEDKEALFRELASIAFKQEKIDCEETFIKCLVEREKCFTTFVGQGIAIPHAKSFSIKEEMVIFALEN